MRDLSENAEFHAAREALVILEGKIADLQRTLATSRVVENPAAAAGGAATSRVAYGATVRVVDPAGGDEEEYRLVGPGEDDFSKNWILSSSPVGRALMGRSVGEEVEVKLPRGTQRLRVAAVRYAS